MDSNLYRDILAEYLVKFGSTEYSHEYKLHQDNDPKHNSELCTQFLKKNDINWVLFL